MSENEAPGAQEQDRPGGHVAAIWRYPVKSTLGEELTRVAVSARGLRGDRAFAFVDAATDRVGSAKYPRLWSGLFALRSRFVEPATPGHAPRVEITLADGTTVRSDDPDCHERLGRELGLSVALATTPPEAPRIEYYVPDVPGLGPDDGSAPAGPRVAEGRIAASAPGTFFDFAPVHLVTTATLDALRDLHAAGHMEAARFRPNLVIQTAPGAEPFAEDRWIGRTLAIGDGVVLAVTHPTPRCVMTTLAQGSLPDDPEVLRTIARHHRVEVPGQGRSACVGAYAQVVREGTLGRGDAVTVALASG